MKKLSIEEIKQIALKYYESGGHRIIECYTDEMIEDWIEEEGTDEKLYKLIDLYNY